MTVKQPASQNHQGPPRCLQCKHRAWRATAGFMVMSCRVHAWRFGLRRDIQRGYVNRHGACVSLPGECKDYERA